MRFPGFQPGMNFSRRDFIKTTSVLCGAAATQLPWELDAAEKETAAVNKNELAALALACAKKLGANYADIRINNYRNESVFTREQQVLNVSRTRSFGFGIRVLYQGAWGFAASHIVTPESIRKVTDQAMDIARANSRYQ